MISILASLVVFLLCIVAFLLQKVSSLQARAVKSLQETEQQRVLVENVRVENIVLKKELSAKAELVAYTDDLLNKTKNWLSERFEGLSQDVLLRSQRSFFDLAKETFSQYHTMIEGAVAKKQLEVGNIISPLRTSLDQMDKKIQELELVRRGAYDVLSSQLQQMSTTQVLLHKETTSLSRALRDPTVRGRWGEVQLRRVVEVAGMLPYCDFDEQVHIDVGDGSIRPDMVVHLPNDRHVVIDAKVSLAAYLDAVACEDGVMRTEKLQQHSKQVRQHVIKLSQKKYWEQFKKMPDFVVLFLHGDCFLAPALEHDNELLEFASSQKILLATPTSLIAMLKVIAYSWGDAKIEKHAQEILHEARTWVERSRTFVDHFCDIGKNLDRSVRAYDRAVGSFENRLLVSVRRLASAGLDVESILPPQYVESRPMSMQHEKAEEQIKEME